MVTGVGAMTWSPLACGIISGKYENGIPETSRASMKVNQPALLLINLESTSTRYHMLSRGRPTQGFGDCSLV